MLSVLAKQLLSVVVHSAVEESSVVASIIDSSEEVAQGAEEAVSSASDQSLSSISVDSRTHESGDVVSSIAPDQLSSEVVLTVPDHPLSVVQPPIPVLREVVGSDVDHPNVVQSPVPVLREGVVSDVADQPISNEKSSSDVISTVPVACSPASSALQIAAEGHRTLPADTARSRVPGYVKKDHCLDAFADAWVPGMKWHPRPVVVATQLESSSVTDYDSYVQMYYGSKEPILQAEKLFFDSQSLGAVVEPRCGGCKCMKCPVPGSRYSFSEQRQFDTINQNLFRKDGIWYTEYPWCCARNVLPRNDKIAYQNLLNLERMLEKNVELASDFCRQVDEMVERGAAIILTQKELANWNSDYYYLPMVGVKGKKK